MRHLKSSRKLSRTPSHRWALMRNLITCLLRDERIQTTDPKAKEVRRWADRVITLGKRGSLHARRQVLGIVHDKAIVRKLFDTLATRFADRQDRLAAWRFSTDFGDRISCRYGECSRSPVREKEKRK